MMDERTVQSNFVLLLKEWHATSDKSVLPDMHELIDKTTDKYWRQELHGSLGDMYFELQQWCNARHQYKRAMEIATTSCTKHHLMVSIAETYCHEGDFSVGYEWFAMAFDVAISDETVGVTTVCLTFFDWAKLKTPLATLTQKAEFVLRGKWKALRPNEPFPEHDLVRAARLLVIR